MINGTSGTWSIGDYIQIGDGEDRELKMIIGVSGQTVTVEPMVRKATFANDPVVYSSPTGLFMLDSDDQALWGVRSKAYLSDVNLSFVERFV